MEPTNTPASIRARLACSRLSWWPVLLFLPARLLFAFLTQGLTAAVFLLQGATDAWAAATARWPVYSTLTDVLCLLALWWLTRREGLTLVDLLGVRGRAALRHVPGGACRARRTKPRRPSSSARHAPSWICSAWAACMNWKAR